MMNTIFRRNCHSPQAKTNQRSHVAFATRMVNDVKAASIPVDVRQNQHCVLNAVSLHIMLTLHIENDLENSNLLY